MKPAMNHKHPLNSPLRAFLVVAVASLLSACQTTQPAAPAMNAAAKSRTPEECKPVIWQHYYTPVTVESGKGQFSIAYCPEANASGETTWQYKKRGGGSWSSPQVVPPANSPQTVAGATGAYIVRINPPKGCATPEPEHFEIMDGWHVPIRVSDMAGGHCPEETHSRNRAKVPVRKGGDAHTKATGQIIVVSTTTAQATDPAGYGRLQVKYLALADQAYSTTYQVSDDGGLNYSSAQPVLPYNTTSSITKRTNLYKIKIIPPAPHSAGLPKDAQVLEDKRRTVNIDYQ